MLIPTYEVWKENAEALFKETHRKESCDECSGSGEVDCCECGHERECQECDGKGEVYFNHGDPHSKKRPSFSPSDYYKTIMKELTMVAKWQGKSPFRLMLPAARAIRKQMRNAVWLRKYRHLTRSKQEVLM